MVHDDIEHVLGYSILQDAGVAVLAFASLEPEAAAAARELARRERHGQDGARGVGRGRPRDVRRPPAGGPRRLGSPLAGPRASRSRRSSWPRSGCPGWRSSMPGSSLIAGAMPGIGAHRRARRSRLMPAIYLGRIALAGIAPVERGGGGGPDRAGRAGAVGRATGWSRGLALAGAAGRARRAPGESRAAHGARRAASWRRWRS